MSKYDVVVLAVDLEDFDETIRDVFAWNIVARSVDSELADELVDALADYNAGTPEEIIEKLGQ